MAARATIVFSPEGAYGPTNNCVGIGQVFRERGHRVVFVIENRRSSPRTERAARLIERLADEQPPIVR